MRRLIISNTHYQTIVSLQLKMTLFKEDDVVFFVSDHSNGSEEIVKRLKQIELFEDVEYIRTRDILYQYSDKDKWRDFFSFSFFDRNRYAFYFDNTENLYFDEIVVFNYEADIYGLHAILSAVNRDVKISMMEEGILSYNTFEKTSKNLNLSCKIRNVLGKKSVHDAVGNFYCFYPSLYQGKYSPVQIPLIQPDSGVVALLKKVFGVDEQHMNYDRKYIFFTSVFDFEGEHPIGEFELVQQVAETVGKENLLVKIHPRDRRTVYHDNGLTVDRNSSVPWEVIQLSHDFGNHVFLTATSGSVLSGNFMTEVPVRTYYMFDLCNLKGSGAEKTVREICNLLNNEKVKEIFTSVHIAKSVGEII